MFNDSDSPQNDLRLLQQWLEEPLTNQMLEALRLEARQLEEVADNHFPNGSDICTILNREKDMGRKIGLRRADVLIQQRLHELQVRTGLIKDKPIEVNEDEHRS